MGGGGGGTQVREDAGTDTSSRRVLLPSQAMMSDLPLAAAVMGTLFSAANVQFWLRARWPEHYER